MEPVTLGLYIGQYENVSERFRNIINIDSRLFSDYKEGNLFLSVHTRQSSAQKMIPKKQTR